MAKTKKNNVRLKKISDFDLETRILTAYVLLEFRNLTAESKSNISELYEVISDLNARAQSFEDEKALDLAVEYDTEKVKSLDDVKAYIASMKKEGLYKMMGFMPLARGENESVRLSQEGLIGTMLAQGNNSSFEMAHKLVGKELDDDDMNRLQEMINQKAKVLKEQLEIDLKTYHDIGITNSRIERFMPAIETMIYPSGRRVKLPFKVKPDKESRAFREGVRKSYNQEVKPAFLRFVGTIFYSGMMMAKHGTILAKSSSEQSDKCLNLLREQYGAEAEKIFDEAFNVKTGETRNEIYNRKAEEMYTKLVAGLLVQKAKSLKEVKQRFDKTRVQEFLRAINVNYINKLKNGENDVFCLGFNSEIVDNSYGSFVEQMQQRRNMIDDTSEDQIVSVHHKISVGSSENLVEQLYSDNVGKIAKASGLVNHMANMCFVIGKKTHRTLEPENEIVINAKPDNMIMAIEIDREELRDMKNYLPQQISDIIEKYVGFEKGQDKEISGVFMTLPEPENAICQLRKSLQPQQKVTLKDRLNLHLNKEIQN